MDRMTKLELAVSEVYTKRFEPYNQYSGWVDDYKKAVTHLVEDFKYFSSIIDHHTTTLEDNKLTTTCYSSEGTSVFVVCHVVEELLQV